MTTRAERIAADAKIVEARLREAGRHLEANAIRALRASHSSARGTLKILHRDNMELRQRLGLPSYLDEKGKKDAGE